MASLTLVLKRRLAAWVGEPSRATSTSSFSPGSWMGKSSECHAAMRCSLRSTIVTSTSGFLLAMTEQVGPPCEIRYQRVNGSTEAWRLGVGEMGNVVTYDISSTNTTYFSHRLTKAGGIVVFQHAIRSSLREDLGHDFCSPDNEAKVKVMHKDHRENWRTIAELQVTLETMESVRTGNRVSINVIDRIKLFRGGGGKHAQRILVLTQSSRRTYVFPLYIHRSILEGVP